MSEQELIDGCLKGDRRAQKSLYEKYASKMFGVSRRYVKTIENAEEVIVEAFCKVFQKMDLYTGQGSFEGWIRRIMVNESLMLLRKRQPLHFPGDEVEFHDHPDSFSIESEISAREILEILDELPPGYRTIFNLYVLEGLKHHEIAELLGISINTSKSQLVLAKEKLRKILKTRGYV